jgi:uncharacterized protein (DUF1697 family)
MKVWIALLRGINVGKNVLSMKELELILEGAGCRDIKTYIQSGNVVFRHVSADNERLAARLQSAVAKGCRFQPRVLLLDRAKLKKAIAANPFPRAAESPKALHLLFLFASPTKPDFQALDRIKVGHEAFSLKGKVLYLYTPDGLGNSRLAQRIAPQLGVEATARNWRTVNAILELANSYE